MLTGYTYLMRGLTEALDVMVTLDGESANVLIRLGAVMLSEDLRDCDWYVYVKLDSPSALEKKRILGVLSGAGKEVDVTIEQLLTHSDVRFVGSGKPTAFSAELKALIPSLKRKAAKAVEDALLQRKQSQRTKPRS